MGVKNKMGVIIGINFLRVVMVFVGLLLFE